MNDANCPFCALADEVLGNELALVQREHVADGFNVGVNVGDAAGQAIAPVHIHLIPRHVGDTPSPRGGVRGVIPDKQAY